MIPATFDYRAPTDLAQAVEMLAEGAQTSCLLAGGTWVVPELCRGDRRVARVIDLRRAGLRGLSNAEVGLEVGAMCTYADLMQSADVHSHCPLLAEMAAQVTGGPQIRNQGTVGGSLAAARAGFDVPTTLVALDAQVRVAGPDGERWVSAQALLHGDRRTGLSPLEVMVAMRVPRREDASYGYCKLKRSESSWPIVTAAAVVAHAGEVAMSARLAIGGVAETPVVLELTASELKATDLSGLLRDRIAAGAAGSAPFEDALAPARYRSAVGPTAARRALASASVSAVARRDSEPA